MGFVLVIRMAVADYNLVFSRKDIDVADRMVFCTEDRTKIKLEGQSLERKHPPRKHITP